MDTYNHQNNQMNSQKKDDKWGVSITIALVAVVVGLLLGYAVFGNKLEDADILNTEDSTASTTDAISTSNTKDTTTTPSNTASTQVTTSEMSLDVNDQAISNRVKVASLKLSEPAWVVTFNSNTAGDAPFKIIGAQYFEAGTYSNISAYLAESTIAGNKYFVALYADDNAKDATGVNRHVFNHSTDKAFVKNGTWIMDSFTAKGIEVSTTATSTNQ
ncbi:MAG TPA: hypothetical protein VI752_00300 [Candidatus Paceibacterota bacterium]